MLTRAMIALILQWNRLQVFVLTLCCLNKSLMEQRQQIEKNQMFKHLETLLNHPHEELGANIRYNLDSEQGMAQIYSSTFLMAIYKEHKITKKILNIIKARINACSTCMHPL